LGNSIHLKQLQYGLFLFHFHPSLLEPTKETVYRRQQGYGMPPCFLRKMTTSLIIASEMKATANEW
jgi:hypothetical protein